MHGVVEIEEVIHTFTPENGLRTTVTPTLLTYDRDPVQLEDVGIINRIYETANRNRAFQSGKAVFGGLSLTAGLIAGFAGNIPLGIELGIIGAPLTYNGIMGATVKYHKFLYEQMGNIMGGDVLNFTALLHKGSPFICGFDGLDYASLKTVINHEVESVNGFVNRLTSFSDPFAAVISTNWNPDEYGIKSVVVNKLGGANLFGLKNNLPHSTYSLWNILNPLSDFGGL